MDLDNIFEPYENIKDDIKFITASDVKTKIIISLKEGHKKLSHLKKDINISSSTILHNMRQLESKKIVKKEFQDYSLSQTGEIIALNLINMIKSIHVTKKNKKYWLDHEINDIPEVLINRLECLSDIQILEHDIAMNLIKKSYYKSKNIKFIHYNKILKEISFETLNEKRCLNFILTEEDIKEILRDGNWQNNLENIRLWQCNKNLKLNLIVLDNLICLNLPSDNSMGENILYLVDSSKEGIKWGNELFNYYLNESEKFRLV